MRLNWFGICLVLFFSTFVRCYECGAIKVEPYGFIAADLFYDTRQVVADRDNFALLWPRRVLLDRFGHDINAHGGWNLTAIQSRFGLVSYWNGIWPESVLKGLIEGDFLGPRELFTGTFRMRHAYLEVITPSWNFLAGQYWHPLFALDCFPDTISFNNGVPMEPKTRVPQLRFTYKHSQGELILMAASQRDFSSLGPIGFDTQFIRNSVVPNLHLHVRLFPTQGAVVGAACDYKRLVPRLRTPACVAVHETIDSIICQVYGGYNGKRVQFCTKFLYGQNGADQTLLSGFAVRTRDPVTCKQTYANTQTVTGWVDAAVWSEDHDKSVGLFIGYAKNLGAQHDLFIDPKTKQPIVFAIDPEVDDVFSVAPRVRYTPKTFRIGLELQYTYVAFGRLDKRARVIDRCPTRNVRLLAEILYFF